MRLEYFQGNTVGAGHFSLFGSDACHRFIGSGHHTKGEIKMKNQKTWQPGSVENIYKLDGRVPVAKAIPFGLQHVLAMFVSNVTPVILIAGVAV